MLIHYRMAEQQEKPKYNSTFKEIKKWKSGIEAQDKYLVFSLITDNDTGKKKLFLNEQGKTKAGEKYSKKGVVIPVALASEVADSLKIASATEVTG